MTIRLDSLKESNEFLNLVVDNMTSAVFLVNKDVRLQQFNNAFKKLFSKHETQLINEFCGNAIGCAFTVDENQICGKTSNCDKCMLRESIFRSFTEKIPTFRAKLHRDFYIRNTRVNKHFLFSSMYMTYRDEEMILVIVDDVTEIETQRLDLLEKQQQLDEDLISAAEIQKSLLPKAFPKIAHCNFASRFIPSQRIGGDIFNVFELDEDRVVIYLLDVSGHGVPAAMVTVSVSQMLSPTTGYFCARDGSGLLSCETELASPKKVLQVLDKHYPMERFDKYFTMSYVVLNHRESTLISCNAGHPPPVILRSGGRIEYLDKGGAFVGLEGMVPFEEEVKTIGNGDRIVFYTDGLTEYTDSSGEAYGEKRFIGTLKNLTSLSAQDTVNHVIDSLLEFGNNASPPDDITLVVLDFSTG